MVSFQWGLSKRVDCEPVHCFALQKQYTKLCNCRYCRSGSYPGSRDSCNTKSYCKWLCSRLWRQRAYKHITGRWELHHTILILEVIHEKNSCTRYMDCSTSIVRF